MARLAALLSGTAPEDFDQVRQRLDAWLVSTLELKTPADGDEAELRAALGFGRE